MATNDSISGRTAASPFQVDVDKGYRPVDEMNGEPALQLNPDASATTLLAAAQRRAESLRKMLYAWACVNGDELSLQDVASTMEPIAQEIEILLSGVSDALRGARA